MHFICFDNVYELGCDIVFFVVVVFVDIPVNIHTLIRQRYGPKSCAITLSIFYVAIILRESLDKNSEQL